MVIPSYEESSLLAYTSIYTRKDDYSQVEGGQPRVVLNFFKSIVCLQPSIRFACQWSSAGEAIANSDLKLIFFEKNLKLNL